MISNCHLNRLNLGHRFLALIFLAGAVNVENVVESGDIYRLPVSNAIQVFALIAGGLKKSSDIGLDTTLWFLYVVSLKHNEYHCITTPDNYEYRACITLSHIVEFFYKKY